MHGQVQGQNDRYEDFKRHNKNNKMMSQKSKVAIKSSDYVPKRFGLKFGTPPTIVLEYLVPSSGKLFHHKMKLRHVQQDSNIEGVVGELMKKHEIYLKSSRISKAQITELVTKLIARLKKEGAAGKPQGVDKENGGTKKVDYDKTDLNKLDDNELAAHKKAMDQVFYKHYKDPKSKDFVYDLEKDFDDVERVDDSWDA
eukprot:TRINITY_DN88025_c1_g1_i1.p4 TRINITY_DN88025_c1_g1~~TRINITY_DN88025_c1_g1_i1.p4  ORF type:complete len:198 (+),score=31.81 TRINITY_DN88025_c1_g1_i1:2250-2843(+)